MQTSSTRFEKPLYLWLARIITLAIILASIGIGVSSLPEILDKLKHEGVVQDVGWYLDQNGEAIIGSVSPTAKQNGIAIGDKVLNYEDDTPGKLGTAVILHIQRGISPARDFTFVRDPASRVVFGGIQLGLPFDVSVTLAFLFTFIPLVVGSVGSLFLYFLRSNERMALFTAMVLANFGRGNFSDFPFTNPAIIIFSNLMLLLTFFWILVFPNGKLMPRWSVAILLLLLPPFVLQSRMALEQISGPVRWDENFFAFYQISEISRLLTYMAMMALFSILYLRYREMLSQAERQQTKWVIIPVVTGLMIAGFIYSANRYAQSLEAIAIGYFFNFFLRTIFFVLLIVGIFFSIVRYRLWDVNTFLSRAIVYGSLTGILGLVGFAVVPLINYVLTQALGNQSGVLGVLVSALPIAALFNPIRDRLQQAVEQNFKPEEMDFENTFIEFTPELRSLFTVKELANLLAHHAVRQLDIAYASVFLSGQDGHLKHVTTICSGEATADPGLDDKTLDKIRRGQLASPDGNYAQSLVVPLVIPRSREPSLLGALFLGPRSQSVGYSTPMVKSLKKFGEEVGKAIYAAEVKSNQKQTLLETE